MNCTSKLRQRFCRDIGVNINIYEDPYFSERLKLLGKEDEYAEFMLMITTEFGGSIDEYNNHYNDVKDEVIECIKNSPAYKELQSLDMNKYKIDCNIRQSDVYKIQNIGKEFISIDMKKANFSSLVAFAKYNKLDFFDEYDWDKFISNFTDVEHIQESKFIRQVIFGNCNCKRLATYEKYIMNFVLRVLYKSTGIKESQIYSLCSDEIIISTDNIDKETEEMILKTIEYLDIPLKFEKFKLGVIAEANKKLSDNNILAYIKLHLYEDKQGKMEVKCVNPLNMPFVYKKIRGENITENDKIFVHEGKLAKLIVYVNPIIIFKDGEQYGL